MVASEKAAQKLLLKLRQLPENRLCPNCHKEDEVGFGSICVPFKTFICSDCKSAHQSFSHRCKSSSQSTWTVEEVKALEEKNGGGNRLARELWLAAVSDGDRPFKDGAMMKDPSKDLEARKRFVERAYIDERWKAKEPRSSSTAVEPEPSEGSSRKEKKLKKEKRRKDSDDRSDRTGWDMGEGHLEMPPTGETSTSRTASPKHRSSHRRRDAPPNGWGGGEFPSGADFAMYNGNHLSGGGGGDGWGRSAEENAWDISYRQAPSSHGDNGYGYGAADPMWQQQQQQQQQPQQPHHNGIGQPSNGMPLSSGWAGMEQTRAQSSHNAAMAHSNGMVGQEQLFQQQAGPFAKQPTPFNSPGLRPANSQSQLAQHTPFNGAPARGAPFRSTNSSSAATSRSSAASLNRAPLAPTRSPRLPTAAKEPLRLSPTNPWADVFPDKLIPIPMEPTNPWSDVVASSFGSVSTGALLLQGGGPATMSCGSQQAAKVRQGVAGGPAVGSQQAAARSQQANQLVY